MPDDNRIHALEKLKEVAYFLNQIDTGNSDAYSYHVSAFLSAWRSVFDILLYDAAEAFDLGFIRTEKRNDHQFLEEAKRLENSVAQAFHVWWKRKLTALSEDPLYKKRSFNVHQGALCARAHAHVPR